MLGAAHQVQDKHRVCGTLDLERFSLILLQGNLVEAYNVTTTFKAFIGAKSGAHYSNGKTKHVLYFLICTLHIAHGTWHIAHCTSHIAQAEIVMNNVHIVHCTH